MLRDRKNRKTILLFREENKSFTDLLVYRRQLDGPQVGNPWSTEKSGHYLYILWIAADPPAAE
jgi:hypothetical protein